MKLFDSYNARPIVEEQLLRSGFLDPFDLIRLLHVSQTARKAAVPQLKALEDKVPPCKAHSVAFQDWLKRPLFPDGTAPSEENGPGHRGMANNNAGDSSAGQAHTTKKTVQVLGNQLAVLECKNNNHYEKNTVALFSRNGVFVCLYTLLVGKVESIHRQEAQLEERIYLSSSYNEVYRWEKSFTIFLESNYHPPRYKETPICRKIVDVYQVSENADGSRKFESVGRRLVEARKRAIGFDSLKDIKTDVGILRTQRVGQDIMLHQVCAGKLVNTIVLDFTTETDALQFHWCFQCLFFPTAHDFRHYEEKDGSSFESSVEVTSGVASGGDVLGDDTEVDSIMSDGVVGDVASRPLGCLILGDSDNEN